MIAHVLLNLLHELGKRDKMRGLPSILSLFRNEFNKFNNTRARMLDSIYHMRGEQCLSGRVLDSRPKGRGFEPHRRHCVVVLEQDTFILA